MRSVAILGAGGIGAAVARALAERECVQHIVMVDASAGVAAGKALDIAQSGPIDGWDARVSGTAALEPALQPSLVVVADRHADGEWLGEPAIEMLRRTLDTVACPVLFAGPGQRGVMEAIARELKRRACPPRRHGTRGARIGGARAHRPRGRALAGRRWRCRSSACPGASSWRGTSRASTDAAAADVFSPPALARLDAQIQASWPPGPYALGSAAAAVAAGILGGSPRRRTAFAVIDGEERRRPAVAAVPVTLGPSGVSGIHVPDLSPRERLAFETGLVSHGR